MYIGLNWQGVVYDLDANKHTVSEIVDIIAAHVGDPHGTWLWLANGGTVHLFYPDAPVYALAIDQEIHKRGS